MQWAAGLGSAGLGSSGMGWAEFAGLAVEHFVEQKEIFKRYYDFDLVGSTEARLGWVKPNLKRFAEGSDGQ